MTKRQSRMLSIVIPKFKRRKAKRPAPGAVPGTLVANPELPPPTIERYLYNAETFSRSDVEPKSLTGTLAAVPQNQTWIGVQGIGDVDALRSIASQLGLHPLTLEDIGHLHQRPKIEEFDEYLYVVVQVCRLTDDGHLENEQMSFVMKDDLLVTFQERHKDGFEPVRKRLREGKGPIRERGVDYLLYSLIDAIIDDYFPVLDLFGDTMDQLDEEIRNNPAPHLASSAHGMRRELRQLRRAVWPLMEVTSTLSRIEVSRIDNALKPAFRDCHDQVVQVADFVEGSRERVSDLSDLYQTMVSEKTNQVMKVLTIMATIFIPLTFLSGLYGMNFDPEVSPFNMPELKWRYGYPAFLAVIALTFVGMMWFFRRKGWIGQPGGSSTRGRDGFIRQDSKDLQADRVFANQQDKKAQ